ncbi:MAG: RNA polymerase III subunit C82 [Geoglossum umbratile]|nr:MAG: RNA polymerase III subunit C82 [Geoglossum umbratile]
MSRHALELCTLLVNDIYGELTSRVLSTLFRYGRLTISQLSQRSHLPLRQLKHGLVVLIQQHLALHYTSPDDGVTYYEADWKSNYSLVRVGKVMRLVEERFGEAAGAVVANLLLQGHVRVGDLADAYGLSAANVRGNTKGGGAGHGVNGQAKDVGGRVEKPALTLGQLHSILHRMLHSGYIMQVTDEQFWPIADYQNDIERAVKRDHFSGGVKGPKQKQELDGLVRERMRKSREGIQSKLAANGTRGIKRPASDTTARKGRKRVKLDYGFETGIMSGDDAESPLVDENLVIRVNHEKFTVAFRNQELVNLSEKRIGSATALVYAELLQRLEAKTDRCRDELAPVGVPDEEEDGPSISTLELSATLNKEIDLFNSIGKVPTAKIDARAQKFPANRRKRRRLESNADAAGSAEDEDEDESGGASGVGSDSDDHWGDEDFGVSAAGDSIAKDQKSRMAEIKKHLQLLAEDSYRFVRLVGSRGLGEWTVDFGALTTILKQTELESIITERFDGIATRLVRILNEKGKLDEKQVSNISLLKQKETRAALTSLYESGFIQLQEVPRDANRQPSRTIYLWYFDVESCRQLVLQDCYKAMARCLQRANAEKGKMRPLLAKAERTDVVGREEHYLSKIERAALQSWKEKEERLLGQVTRLDRLVGIFRDY